MSSHPAQYSESNSITECCNSCKGQKSSRNGHILGHYTYGSYIYSRDVIRCITTLLLSNIISTGKLCISALLHQEMASLRCMMLSLVFILLIFSLHVSSSNATRYGGLVNMQKRVNSRQVLQDLLGSNLPKTIRNNNKVGGGKDRLAPEGPDPEHH